MILENNHDKVSTISQRKKKKAKINIHDTNDTYFFFFTYTSGRGNSNPSSLLGGDQALLLSHRALGTYSK